MSKRNIAIVWDFDGTLTPQDSTSAIVEELIGKGQTEAFWADIKKINGSKSEVDWERILASDAPTWMYVLSTYAYKLNIPLETEYFKKKKHLVSLFPNVENFLERIIKLQESEDFKACEVNIHHFIVSAGLKDYVKLLVKEELVAGVWGCRYRGIVDSEAPEKFKSVPVFCMDETMKTRAIFEIAKGVFNKKTKAVNVRVEDKNLWAPFENIIYIGDGPTDVPALAVVRDRGGFGIVLYDGKKSKADVKSRLKEISADKRCDFITEADFSKDSDLEKAIANRCSFILKKYQVEDFAKS